MTRLNTIIGKLSLAVLFLGLILLPIVSHAGGLGIAPLGFIFGCAGLLFLLTKKSFRVPPLWVCALIGLLLWSMLTTLWTIYDPEKAFYNILILLVMVPALCAMSVIFRLAAMTDVILFRHLLMSSTFVGVGVLIIDLLSGYGLNMVFDPLKEGQNLVMRHADAEMNLGHGITAQLLLLAPVLVLMWSRLRIGKALAVLLAAGLVLAGYLCQLAVAPTAVAAILFAMAVASRLPQITITVLFGGAFSLIVGAPLIGFLSSLASPEFLLDLPLSWEHRVRMWAFCWDRIAEAPLIGHGFDAVRTYDESFIARDGREIVIVSLHPHNAGLQIWTETGLIGAALAGLTIFGLYKPALELARHKPRAVALAGFMASVIVVSALTYGVWQYWWWGMVFIGGAVLWFVPREMTEPQDVIEL